MRPELITRAALPAPRTAHELARQVQAALPGTGPSQQRRCSENPSVKVRKNPSQIKRWCNAFRNILYNARNGSDTRSELGARFDQALPLATTAVLALNARAAWAHDWVTNPSLTPVFQALPGASFIVNGATPVSDSALLSAGGELRFLNGWAIAGRFDGEFADRAQTYAGTGTLRYVW